MKRLIIFFLLLFAASLLHSQVLEPAKWQNGPAKSGVEVGQEVDLVFRATIDPNWYLYSSDFDPDCGPIVTTLSFDQNDTYELVGEVVPVDPIDKYDDIFECDVRIFKNTGVFRQKIRVLDANISVAGSIDYQVCSDITGQCISFEEDFSFSGFGTAGYREPERRRQEEQKPEKKDITESGEEIENTAFPEAGNSTEIPAPEVSPSEQEVKGPILDKTLFEEGELEHETKSLWGFMVLAFLAGLTALITPCVFPMIPMTVTYFTSRGGTGKALIYGVSIIVIFTLIGAALTPFMGPETANSLSTEWLPNILFFIIFVFFALSFFGMFDLTLPSGFVNSIDRKADKGGLTGVFFMAFTLVLVSFSCTGPIVGSILVMSAGNEFLKPVMGMLAFSLAFAIPFTLFAIFPQWLNSLPKSGGWLNSVKVVLGFIELALAFKFLSIADQAYHWGILDRDINIAIWVVIFTLMGFYLLGKIRLPHDSRLEVLPVPRLILAIATFSFVLYLIPGLWGAPLKALAGYLPPMYTHDFNLVSTPQDEYAGGTCDDPKYAEFLHLPHGLKGYFDYEQAIQCARAQNKPLFIDFTGHGCTNCREMEAVVWSDPQVLRRLREEYVLLALYVDDKTELPESEWYTSEYDDKLKKTIGKQNADLQIRSLNNNAQPFYVLLGADEKVLVPPGGYNRSVSEFVEFLDKGKARYDARYLN